ncbi:Card1-like endonuclease domain-containing protein [Flavobacterium sp. GCM10023249]|uniref:Card1-like endonuclease domain-containing protein n=1 Tax=unclassified Flavobacterium TaxID=196869 RepID=UPI00360FBF7A
MKHQIALVGGQLLPIYVGIKEFNPDKIHFIVSKESVESLNNLKPMIIGVSQSEYKCNPFDFYEIKAICEKIIQKVNSEDSIIFNLTGGTKIMVLACQAIIHEKGLNGFYINQDDSFLTLPSYDRKSIGYELSVKEFFDISGHSTYNYKTINDYIEDDLRTAEKIKNFANTDSRYKLIIGAFRKKYFNKGDSLPVNGKESINNNLKVIWDQISINIESNNKNILKLNSKIVQELFFKAVWWELIVAKEIANSKNFKELFLGFELTFKADKNVTKNEIDVLINTGKKLIFIECKSGLVKQEDINKMRVVKQTYGGVIAKSILICRELPNQSIIEKCKELDIELFYSFAMNKEVNPLSKLSKVINDLERKTSI